MLTPNDIRNPARQSGFDHVNHIGGANVSDKQWRASWRVSPTDNTSRGTARCTELEAAQDYCDYMNGLPAAARRKVLKTANHPTRRKSGRKVPPEVAAAYGVIRDHHARARAEAKNYIYLIAEKGGQFVKIGESAKPPARPGECQTGNARLLILLAYYEVAQLRDADKVLHQQFADAHVLNEWFHPTDALLSHFKVTRKEFTRRCGVKKTKGVKTST